MEDTKKTREIVSLRYLTANESMFMLVMYLALDGNNKDQVKYMHKKANAWATYIIVRGVKKKQSTEILKLNNTRNNEIPLI